MSERLKKTDLWVMRFPIGKLWKLLRYSTWTVSLLILLMCAILPSQISSAQPLFPNMLSYVCTFSFLVFGLEALTIPYMVRALGTKLRLVTSLFRKLVFAFSFIVSIMAMNSIIIDGGFYLLKKELNFHLFEHLWFVLFLALSYILLAFWAVLMMARDLAERMTDSLRVLTNGMNLASKLDFDAPIVTLERDEIGSISDTFSKMTTLIKFRVGLLHTLFNNVRIFSGLLSAESILEHTFKTFESLKEAKSVVVSVWDEHSDELVVVHCSSDNEDVIGSRFTMGQGILGELIKEQQFLTFNDEEYMKIAAGCMEESHIWGRPNFVVAIPMMFKGKLKGAITLYDMNLGDFQMEAKMDYFQALANQIANFLENARLYQLVIRDRLTGLYVHSFVEASLEDILAQAKRYKFPVCYFMLDVDKFKQINDQYGHSAGNKLLIALSDIIKSVSRDADLPARFGGDEFEIILPHTDRNGGVVYGQKLRDAVEKMSVEVTLGVNIGMTMSIGMAVYPQDAQTSPHLHSAADKALYSAKTQGRNRMVTFDAIPK